jgi:DNA-directed RNA polymerase subunit H
LRRLNPLSSEKKEIRIVDHVFQPKHEILPKEDAELIFKKFNSKPSQLPYIMASDKGIQGLNAQPSDIIKITRKSSTAGESVYYRYVVEG